MNEDAGRRRSRPSNLFAWLHLAALWTFAIAQPLLDLLGDNPEFFVARGSTRFDIVVFALALTLVPPTLLLGIELLFARAERLQLLVHVAFVAGLASLLALHAVKDVSAGKPSLLLAALIGLAAAALYARWEAVRSFLSVLSPAPLLFVFLFLFISPAHELVLGGGDDARAAAASTRTPIVMVLFDELPLPSLLSAPGRIDAERFPNFAALAGDSTWFPNTWAAAENTTYAIPAILTGERPETDELPTSSDHPNSVFTLFANSHRLNVWESITSICPSDLCERERNGFLERMRSLTSDVAVVSGHQLLPDNLEDRLPSVSGAWSGFAKTGGGAANANQQLSARASRQQDRLAGVDRVLDQAAQGGSRPSLNVIHTLLPHMPWQYLPSGRQYSEQDLLPGYEDNCCWGKDRLLPLQAYERHLLQLKFVDSLLGRIVARLRKIGLYDRAAIVVAADHGVSFAPGGSRRGLSRINAGEIVPVPFLLHEPGQREPRVVRSNIQTIDILPTLVDAVDARVPWQLDGRSALDGSFSRDRIEVQRDESDPITFDPAELARMRDAVVRHKREVFGTGRDSLYVAGSHRELLGTRPALVGRTRAAEASASIDQAILLHDVDLSSAFLPAFITGTLEGTLPEGADLAVAVNGTIFATARPFDFAGARKFAALVPEDALRSGENRVEVLAIETAGGRTRLATLNGDEGEQGSYTLEGDRIESSAGERIEIEPDWVLGNIDRSEVVGNAARFVGWAASVKARRPADAVVVFADGRFVAAVRPTVPRPDVAQHYSVAEIARSGWNALVPLSSAQPSGDSADVELYAVVGDRASKLNFDCSREPQDFGC